MARGKVGGGASEGDDADAAALAKDCCSAAAVWAKRWGRKPCAAAARNCWAPSATAPRMSLRPPGSSRASARRPDVRSDAASLLPWRCAIVIVIIFITEEDPFSVVSAGSGAGGAGAIASGKRWRVFLKQSASHLPDCATANLPGSLQPWLAPLHEED